MMAIIIATTDSQGVESKNRNVIMKHSFILWLLVIGSVYHGCRDGALVRAGTGLPPMWSRFDFWTQHHMWVEFVVGSRPCFEISLQVFRFCPLLKNQHFQIPYTVKELCAIQIYYLFTVFGAYYCCLVNI